MEKEKTEKEIEKEILNYLDMVPGCYAWKNDNITAYKSKKISGKHRPNGVSDILGIYHGKLLCIEVKKMRGSVISDEQRAFIGKINSLGGMAFVAKSVDVVADKLRYINESVS